MISNKDFNLKEKDVYKLFNGVKLEESEFDVLDEEIGILQKSRIKKNLSKRIQVKNNLKVLKYGSAVAIIGLICLIGIGTASPAFAQNIPILNSVTQIINDKLGFHVDYTKYSQLVNKSITDNGVKVTINEVLADDSKLIIGYTLKSDKKIKDLEAYSISQFLNINGKPFGSGGSAKGYYLDDYTYIESEEMHTTLPKNSDKFNVGFKITEIGDVKGHWDFSFSMSKAELIKNSTIFKPNTKSDLPDKTINVDKVVFSPIDTALFISGSNKNKPIHTIPDLFLVYDDKGVELISKGYSSFNLDDSTLLFKSEIDFLNLKNIPKYLTAIPYTITHGDVIIDKESIDETGKRTQISHESKKVKEISKLIDGTYPIELSEGDFGKLIINKISTENNETIVRYTSEGKAPATLASRLYITDSKGGGVNVEKNVFRENNDKPNEFTMAFKALDPKEKYSIGTEDFSDYKLREDLKFNIELNK